MQLVEPFICGRLRMKIESKLPTRPKIPTPLRKTDGTKNSKIKSTSGSGIVSFAFTKSVVLLRAIFTLDEVNWIN